MRVEGEISTQDAWRGPAASGGPPDFPGERMIEREKVGARTPRTRTPSPLFPLIPANEFTSRFRALKVVLSNVSNVYYIRDCFSITVFLENV